MIKPKWEYCECGCKGSSCGPLWMYNDLKGKLYLYKGHGFHGRKVGEFNSEDTNLLDRTTVEFIQKEIRNLTNLLKDI